jgi:large subunit ribosomal protein L19
MKAQGYTKETIKELGERVTGFPEFNIGDTIAVHQRIKEGDKERIQIFEGDVLAIRNNGAASSFTVRKMGAHAVAVERIIPFHSPLIKTIEVIKRGDVRRAKLYYVRDRMGRSARIKEKVVSHEQKELKAARQAQATEESSAE